MGTRQAGVLLPVFSLPSSGGIGTMGHTARRFIDLLAQSGQRIWQILPLCPPDYSGSPYSSHSAHAGNPLFIDMDLLVEQGLLDSADVRGVDWGKDQTKVSYTPVTAAVEALLRLAYERCPQLSENREFLSFLTRNPWVEDYALFMALKKHYDGKPWYCWEQGVRDRNEAALEPLRTRLASEIEFHQFTQWIFDSQWESLHAYANAHGIQILGDIPIYVSLDSVDTWVNPELFQLGEDKKPQNVAGVPPDGFSATGQIWGNPLYDWLSHRSEGYSWWKHRIAQQLKRVDLLRIDHFRGLESYFSVPATATSAAAGHWEPGPKQEFFRTLENHFGTLPFILEDLGYLTDAVKQLKDDTGLPGIQLIQFAFDSREPTDYWPYEMPRNSVVYTGTHDNDTVRGWFSSLSTADQKVARRYTSSMDTAEANLPDVFVTLAMTSVADTCIIPLADYLRLGSEARINVPSKTGGNWQWRLSPAQLEQVPWEEIFELTRIAGRCPV